MTLPLRILATSALVLIVTACIAASTSSAAANSTLEGYGLDRAGACQITGRPSSALLRPKPDLQVERSDDSGREYSDAGLTIDQPVIEVTRALRPGDSFSCAVTIRNRRAASATYDISVAGLLGSRTEQTRVVPIDAPDIGATAATWVDPVVDSITLAPEQKATIPFVITVPPDAPTGGVYASIQFVTRPLAPADGPAPQVGVTTGAAASLLLSVGGEGRAKLAFTDTRTHKLRTSRASWTWRARLDNDGTAQALPEGRVRVRSIFGRTVARFTIQTRPLLPKGGVPVSVTWKGTPWIGIYRWDARVGAAGDAKATPARASGWIIALPPWWMVGLAVLLLAAVIAWPFVRRQREWRRYVDDEDDDEDLDDPSGVATN